MITLRIQLKNHLASYLTHRYAAHITDGVIHLPANCALYHVLYQLTTPRPLTATGPERGNVTLALPSPQRGKRAEKFNYLSQKAVRNFEQEVDEQMHFELFRLMQHNKIRHGMSYVESVNRFMEQYGLTELNEESLIKSERRWRQKHVAL